jgi:hypothetical protein|tara:strand:+ start:600 stop:1175 length:576 start_codon:yes stop_codon:yes gene_type:complete
MTKPLILTSPKGKAIFPHLTEPDTKYKAEGEYHVKLECNKSEGQNIIALIGSEIAKKVKEQHDLDPKKPITKAPLPYVEVNDKVVFNFKMKASGIRKSDGKHFTQKPVLVNADLSPVEPDMQIWGDSILKITFEPYAWNMPIGIGCTLRLKAVQVLELVTGKSSNTLGELKAEPIVAPKVKEEVSEGVFLP